jgi:hypothetical protein
MKNPWSIEEEKLLEKAVLSEGKKMGENNINVFSRLKFS